MMSITKNTFIIFAALAATSSSSVDAARGLRGTKQQQQSISKKRNLQQDQGLLGGLGDIFQGGINFDGIMEAANNQQAQDAECWHSYTQEEKQQLMAALSGQGGMMPQCDPAIVAKYTNQSVEEVQQQQAREAEMATMMAEQAQQQAEQQAEQIAMQTAQILMLNQPGLTMEEALQQIEDFSNFGQRKLQQDTGLLNGLAGNLFQGGEWDGIMETINNQQAQDAECWDSYTQEEKQQLMSALSGQGGFPPQCDPAIVAKYTNQSVEEVQKQQEREAEIATMMAEQAQQQAEQQMEQINMGTAQILMANEPGLTMEEALKRIEESSPFASF